MSRDTEKLFVEDRPSHQAVVCYSAGVMSHSSTALRFKTQEEAIRNAVENWAPGSRPPDHIEVTVWALKRINGLTELLVYNSPLRTVLNNLDEELNADGETEPTDEMKRAEKFFIREIVRHYTPVDFERVKTWQEPFDPEKYGSTRRSVRQAESMAAVKSGP